MAEIPHKWFFKGRECQMLGPILNDNNKIVGLHIEQDGTDWHLPVHDDGTFGQDICYELIN